MNETLSFAYAGWIHLLWIVLFSVVVLIWLVRRQKDSLSKLVAPVLVPALVSAPSTGRKLWRIVLLGLMGSAITVAIMRPQIGYEVVQRARAGAAIMICLDVSRSMLAEDSAPNRLERAKAEIRDLLPLLDGDQVGLIAFAGRASVLSPLTPDFGFLRLALDDASPGSVSIGGTRLEEPIRKAVDGLASATDVSRSIILITDGEDHDSYANEAAKYAAERGVRILAIGFGDETGSTIRVTDPTTGAVTTIVDADGNPVVSRLDGDLLRELALMTDGAYIPAGTGALDLRSIYTEHIAPLTRGSLQSIEQTVRHDAYQWAILAALAMLLAALLTTQVRRNTRASRQVLMCAVACSLAASVSAPTDANAQSQTATGQKATGQQTTDQSQAPAQALAEATDEKPLPTDPRQAYNDGLAALLAGELDSADQLFQHAPQYCRHR